MNKACTLFALSLMAICASACSFAPDNRDDWGSNLYQLGIQPIYPPREDVYVGDVYVIYPKDPNKIGTLLTRLDIAKALNREYSTVPQFPAEEAPNSSNAAPPAAPAKAENNKRRPAFAATPDAAPEPPKVAPSKRDRQENSVFQAPIVVTHLKDVAFPELHGSAEASAGIAAVIPETLRAATFSMGLGHIESVNITVSDAESYAIPWDMIANCAYDSDGKLAIGCSAAKHTETIRWLCQLDAPTRPAGLYSTLEIITEVYYAHRFNVDIVFASNAAGGLNLPPTGAAVTASSTALQRELEAPTTAASSAAALQQKLLKLTQVTNTQLAGESISGGFLSANEMRLSINFARPIAIGYRGVMARQHISPSRCAAAPEKAVNNYGMRSETRRSTIVASALRYAATPPAAAVTEIRNLAPPTVRRPCQKGHPYFNVPTHNEKNSNSSSFSSFFGSGNDCAPGHPLFECAYNPDPCQDNLEIPR